MTSEEDSVQNRCWDIHQDCEEVEEPEVAAGGAPSEDRVVVKRVAYCFTHCYFYFPWLCGVNP